MLYTKVFFILSLATLALGTIQAEMLRILPLGDSITYDNNHNDDEVKARPKSKRIAYRGPLWSMLKDSNVSFDFVGTRQAGKDYAPDFDTDNDGYPSYTSHEIAEMTYRILQQTNPNVILLHIGTNDHSTNISGVEEILNWIDTYENDSNQQIRVIVALIIHRQIADKKIEGFNQNLVKMLKSRRQNGDMITIVDMYGGLKLNDNDYIDVTHPNPRGYAKMAKAWFDVINKPYVPFSTAPITKDDKVKAETGTSVSINVLANDKDYQNDMDNSSVKFSNGSNKLTITGEGEWSVDSNGIVTFKPNNNFFSDPTPVQYTVKDKEGTESKPASIFIDYSNASLEIYPTSIVPKPYIESIDIDEATNSVTFITRVPNIGIAF